MKLPILSLLLFVISVSTVLLAEEERVGTEKGVNLNGKPFPWELIMDRGKINGCIYKNAYYSAGSVLIEETLPRKCKIDPNRDGYWAELDERELELFEASVKSKLAKDAELLKVGHEPLSDFEMRMVSMIRYKDKWEER